LLANVNVGVQAFMEVVVTATVGDGEMVSTFTAEAEQLWLLMAENDTV